MSNEKKLVEALKAFMEKGIIPYLGESHPSLSQWKYLNGILSSENIDSSQLEFYILMANKAGNSGIKNNPSPPQKSPQSFQIGNTPNSYSNESSSNKQKLSFAGDRRKQLLSNMQNFHGTMMKNQEKLETFNKKTGNTSTTLNVSTSFGYTTNSKKYI